MGFQPPLQASVAGYLPGLRTMLFSTTVGALVAWPQAVPEADVLMASLNTAAHWSAGARGGLLAWPQGLQVDNHWVLQQA